MEAMEPLLVISCSQARCPVDGLDCIQLSCWPRGSHRNPQTVQADATTKGCALKTSTPLLRTTSTPLIEHGEAELGLTWMEHSPLSCTPVCRNILFRLPKGKHGYQYKPQKFWPTICPSYKIYWGNGGRELVGVANQHLIWLTAYSTRRNPYATLLR